VLSGDIGRIIQVRQRACNTKYPRHGARAQPEFRDASGEERIGGPIDATDPLQRPAFEAPVRRALTVKLSPARLDDAGANGGR
jgi:hypothetical protein